MFDRSYGFWEWILPCFQSMKSWSRNRRRSEPMMALNCGVLRIEAFVATWSGKFMKTFPRSSIVVWVMELNFTEPEIDSASLLRQGFVAEPIEGRR